MDTYPPYYALFTLFLRSTNPALEPSSAYYASYARSSIKSVTGR